MNLIYVTGNLHKAKYFAAMVGIELEHASIDLEEIQSLDLREVVADKARRAYEKCGKPVIVEDTKLVFKALGQLPGPFIKFFQQEIGHEGLCRLVDGKDRTAFAGAAIAYYDGVETQIFESELEGEIVDHPSGGDTGFGWNVIFRPKGSKNTFAEMDDSEFKHWYKQVKPFDEIKALLARLEA